MTEDGLRLERLEARARTVIASISSDVLAEARWSGLGGRSVRSIELLDVFEFEDGGGLAVLEAWTATDGEAIRLTLPFPGAAPWPGLDGLARGGGTVTGARGGQLIGRPAPGVSFGGPAAAAESVIRASAVDQSHTSVVIDERVILKLYRRLSPGSNPEAEILAALAAIPDSPVPAWRGEVDLLLPDGGTTAVAIAQAFVAGAGDAFELLAGALAAWLCWDGDPVPTTIPVGTGLATGRLHAALAGLDRPGFETRPATPADRAAWLRAAEAGLGAAVRAVGGVDAVLAARIERAGPTIRHALRPLGDPAIPVRLQRIHGDLHLGQVLPTADGVLLVDFEGDPTRGPAERRGPAAPLRDVAAFLRSIDHVARSGARRAGLLLGAPLGPAASAALDGWIEGARAAFLAGYEAGLGDPAWSPDRALLRAFEVEKEVGELVYAATFLPSWLYAPAGGLHALLGAMADGEVPQ